MSGEPALMSLVSVAKAIAAKKFSSREVTQSCLAPDRAMAAARQRLHGNRRRRSARRRGRRRCGARQGQECRRAARRAAGAQGHVLRRRQGRHLRFENPPRLRGDDDLDRVATAEGTRALSGSARCRWSSSLTVQPATTCITARCVTPGMSITSPAVRRPVRVRPSRLVRPLPRSVRIPAARSGCPRIFCGVTGFKTTVGLISRAGAMPLSQSLDTVGPLAQTVEDARRWWG